MSCHMSWETCMSSCRLNNNIIIACKFVGLRLIYAMGMHRDREL